MTITPNGHPSPEETDRTESVENIRRAVAALAIDGEVTEKSGQTLTPRDLGDECGFTHGKAENKKMRDRIEQIESYVRQLMSTVTASDLRIAHDFKHVDRVRAWATRIADSEASQDVKLVEAAALLHDIGLTCVAAEQRSHHAQVGTEIAGQFLREHHLFSEEEIGFITDAIRCHASATRRLTHSVERVKHIEGLISISDGSS